MDVYRQYEIYDEEGESEEGDEEINYKLNKDLERLND
jgi:hypothetical protein